MADIVHLKLKGACFPKKQNHTGQGFKSLQGYIFIFRVQIYQHAEIYQNYPDGHNFPHS